MSDRKLLLTAREVAALTGFSEGTIRHWVSELRIPFVRISNRCVRFRWGAIEQWIAEKSVNPSDSTHSRIGRSFAARSHSTSTDGISELKGTPSEKAQ